MEHQHPEGKSPKELNGEDESEVVQEKLVVTLDGNKTSELEGRAKPQQNTVNTPENSEYQEISKISQLETAESEQQTNPGEKDVGIKGGYDYKLEGEAQLPVEGVEECPICHLIPRKPAKVGCCGNIFCLSCIETHYNEDKQCPLCRSEEDFKWMIDKLQERKIMGLKVLCVNHKKGCDWKGELKNAENHSKKDPYEVSDGVRGCKYQLTTCKKCDEEIMYIELNNHLKNTCKHRDKDCPFKFAGCNFRGPESGMSKHLHKNTTDHLTLVAHFMKRDKQVKDEDIASLKRDKQVKDEVIASLKRDKQVKDRVIAHFMKRDKRVKNCLRWLWISFLFVFVILTETSTPQRRQHDIEKYLKTETSTLQRRQHNIEKYLKTETSTLQRRQHNIEKYLKTETSTLQRRQHDIEKDLKTETLTLQRRQHDIEKDLKTETLTLQRRQHDIGKDLKDLKTKASVIQSNMEKAFKNFSDKASKELKIAMNLLKASINESSETTDSKVTQIKRKVKSNELAIQSLHYDIEQDIEVQMLTLKQNLKRSQEEIDQLKIDIDDLNSGFTKHVDDLIKKALNFSFFSNSRVDDKSLTSP